MKFLKQQACKSLFFVGMAVFTVASISSANSQTLSAQNLSAQTLSAQNVSAQPLNEQSPRTYADNTQMLNKQTLDRIKLTGVFRLGFRHDDRPFSYLDTSGNAAGYAVVLCKRVADAVQAELGLSKLVIEEVAVSGEERFDAVQNGDIDLLCGAASQTIARREVVSFSIPIFLSGIGALTRADAPPRLQALLAGEEPEFRPRWRASYAHILQQRTVSVLSGTSAEKWVGERISEFGIIANIVPIPDYKTGIERVLERRSDVLFGDRAILLESAKRNSASKDLIVIHRYFTHETIALALQRNDEDFRLLIDKTLSELYSSGDIVDIYMRFFGEPDSTAQNLFIHSALPK